MKLPTQTQCLVTLYVAVIYYIKKAVYDWVFVSVIGGGRR
jgi:hypothetical protein